MRTFKLKDWLDQWRKRLDYERRWRAWKRLNPAGNRAIFYAVDAPRRIAIGRGAGGPRTLGLQVEPQLREPRAQLLLEALRAIGLEPHHRVVDYGCGSLWVGEVFMRFLQPGNYIGLDVIDHFYLERLPLLPPGLVDSKWPTLAVISPEVVAQTAARQPDFLIATAVLLHVRPRDVAGFLAGVMAASGPNTHILLQQRWRRRTLRYDGSKWRHGHRTLERAAARLGCRIDWHRGKNDPLKPVHLCELRRHQ